MCAIKTQKFFYFKNILKYTNGHKSKFRQPVDIAGLNTLEFRYNVPLPIVN